MGSKSAGTQTTTTAPWSKTQRQGLNQGYEQATGLLDQELEYYPGSTVAGFGDTTQQAQGALAAAGYNPAGLEGAIAANANTVNGGNLGGNPHLEAAVTAAQRPTLANYQRAIAPSLSSRFAAGGRFGSGSQANAEGAAQERLARELADSANTFAYGDYGRERALQEAAIARTPALGQAQLGGLSTSLGVGGQQDAKTQQMLSDDVNRFNFEQDADYNQLARILPLLAGQTGSLTSQPQYENPLATALGTGAGLAAIATPFLLSDEDTKEDVKKVGKLDSGDPVYTYRYKGEPTMRMGVIAQKLTGKNKKALRPAPGGLLGVDYGRVG